MKKQENTNLSDLLKLGETALNVLLGAGQELAAHASDKRDSLVRKMDLVTREEFDAAFAMLKKARAMQESLHKRLCVVEEKLTLSRQQKPVVKKQIRKKK